jgi:hypothetical protein
VQADFTRLGRSGKIAIHRVCQFNDERPEAHEDARAPYCLRL